MKSALLVSPASVPIPLEPLLTSPKAAKLLDISERSLWQLTEDGEIPVVRLGRSKRYDPADLRRFIDRRKGV